VGAVEEVPTHEVQHADEHQRHVEQEHRLGEHTEATDGGGPKVVAGDHRGREHDDGRELGGGNEEERPYELPAVERQPSNREGGSFAGFELRHGWFTTF
jgi:hypothetical protein